MKLFTSEEEAIKWVGLNIPWAVKPKKKTDSIKFINPFTSVHAHDVVVETLGKQLFKLQQKQHLIDMMTTPLENNNMAQTSVEWLFETLAKTPMTEWYEIREKAIKKHKEDCINFAEEWEARCNEKDMDSKEQLYDKIYNK